MLILLYVGEERKHFFLCILTPFLMGRPSQSPGDHLQFWRNAEFWTVITFQAEARHLLRPKLPTRSESPRSTNMNTMTTPCQSPPLSTPTIPAIRTWVSELSDVLTLTVTPSCPAHAEGRRPGWTAGPASVHHPPAPRPRTDHHQGAQQILPQGSDQAGQIPHRIQLPVPVLTSYGLFIQWQSQYLVIFIMSRINKLFHALPCLIMFLGNQMLW